VPYRFRRRHGVVTSNRRRTLGNASVPYSGALPPCACAAAKTAPLHYLCAAMLSCWRGICAVAVALCLQQRDRAQKTVLLPRVVCSCLYFNWTTGRSHLLSLGAGDSIRRRLRLTACLCSPEGKGAMTGFFFTLCLYNGRTSLPLVWGRISPLISLINTLSCLVPST